MGGEGSDSGGFNSTSEAAKFFAGQYSFLSEAEQKRVKAELNQAAQNTNERTAESARAYLEAVRQVEADEYAAGQDFLRTFEKK